MSHQFSLSVPNHKLPSRDQNQKNQIQEAQARTRLDQKLYSLCTYIRRLSVGTLYGYIAHAITHGSPAKNPKNLPPKLHPHHPTVRPRLTFLSGTLPGSSSAQFHTVFITSLSSMFTGLHILCSISATPVCVPCTIEPQSTRPPALRAYYLLCSG